jgi:hypothetical protein
MSMQINVFSVTVTAEELVWIKEGKKLWMFRLR